VIVIGLLRVAEDPMRMCAIIPRSVATLAALLVLGCQGDDEFETRYPVSGRVTYKDEPLAEGTINFIPAKGGRSCYGSIKDGYYSLTTHSPSDGAVPGKYDVTIAATEINMYEAFTKKKIKGASPTPQEIIRARKAEKNLVPPKYKTPKTSGLTAEVKPETNRFDFDLVD
jgi:hypothetical protein